MAVLNTLGAIAGKAGKAIDTFGRAGVLGIGVPGVNSFQLPDLRISENLERYGGMLNPPRAYAASSGPLPYSQPVQNASQQPYSWAPQRQQETNVNLGRSGGGGQPQGMQYQQPTFNAPNEQFGGSGKSEMDIINDDFNAFSSLLDQQESQSKANFSEAENILNTQSKNQEALLTKDKTAQIEGVKKNESLNLAKVRQLLSDLSQRDAARTAITGGNSSMSEALAERFGRKAQEGVGNVMEQASQAIERTNMYFNQKVQELRDNTQTALFNAKQVLDERLGQIASARLESASKKQQASLGAWKEYYNNVNQAKRDAASFQAQLDMWKQQQDTAYNAWTAQNQDVAEDYGTGIQPSFEASNYTTNSPIAGQQQASINPQYQIFKPRPGDEDEEAARLGLNYSPGLGSTIDLGNGGGFARRGTYTGGR